MTSEHGSNFYFFQLRPEIAVVKPDKDMNKTILTHNNIVTILLSIPFENWEIKRYFTTIYQGNEIRIMVPSEDSLGEYPPILYVNDKHWDIPGVIEVVNKIVKEYKNRIKCVNASLKS